MKYSIKSMWLTVIFIVVGFTSGLIFNKIQRRNDNSQKAELLQEYKRRKKYQLDMLVKTKMRIKSVVDKVNFRVDAPQQGLDSTTTLLHKGILVLMETEHMIEELQELSKGDSTLFVLYGK